MPGNYRYQEVSENCNVVPAIAHNQPDVVDIGHDAERDEQISNDQFQNEDRNNEANSLHNNGHEGITADQNEENRQLDGDQYHHQHRHLQQLHSYDDESNANECCQRTNVSLLHHRQHVGNVETHNLLNDSGAVGESSTATTNTAHAAQSLLL